MAEAPEIARDLVVASEIALESVVASENARDLVESKVTKEELLSKQFDAISTFFQEVNVDDIKQQVSTVFKDGGLRYEEIAQLAFSTEFAIGNVSDGEMLKKLVIREEKTAAERCILQMINGRLYLGTFQFMSP